MYLAELTIKNFRKLRDAKLEFQPGLNVLVGPNNVGKSAVVDALRTLLAGHEEPYPRLDIADRHRPTEGESEGDISFHFVFKDLSHDDEADFIAALQPSTDNSMEAHIHVRYTDADQTGRFRVKRWCGDHQDIPLTSDMMENLRGVYLQPLRDAAQGLRPSRNSQLARLLHLLTDDEGREKINTALKELDEQLQQNEAIKSTHAAISTRHGSMMGEQLAQVLAVGLSATDFQRLSARLSLSAQSMEIEQNGLGFNNLIFMAVVLSELAKNPEAAYRSLIVEEPEAHLHPQLQRVLLRYLAGIPTKEGEKPVQLFVTSHSPNFASNSKLESLVCLVENEAGVKTFFPRDVQFAKGKREKLERYLDVTRAELFFARRVIFVEGAAELMLVDALAKVLGFDLREYGISLISVEGLNFDSFLPLFGENGLRIPVSVITDADPFEEEEVSEPAAAERPEEEIQEELLAVAAYLDEAGAENGDAAVQLADEGGESKKKKKKKLKAAYPSLGEAVRISSNTLKMKESEDQFVKVHHGVKTLEYDLALQAENRDTMLKALAELHPRISVALRKIVDGVPDNTAKAKALFCGMFERKDTNSNVQKGRFGQALAEQIALTPGFKVPEYLEQAIRHVCQGTDKP
ncbi:AAA family ATPase [Pseudomonas aeruginosa]|uniref:ATP-dependent nuclease n=1 Tax=Stutzerimonas stutzeri group TaxID=136846 RepID=UPI001909262F|nr:MULTISPECIES: AAA family ATPase [Stutzerimonas stutzeri group]MBK3758728.1 AAA family ATPase [Stutzerimonas frequens]MBU0835683.1 AAA family ATPase [Alphaproteobacteria bacterium]MCF6755763.1 AAA family ATPase [Stutzerimonas balearica]MDP5617748.1 AAA family ATPase [Pseudomonas aeruginosa]